MTGWCAVSGDSSAKRRTSQRPPAAGCQYTGCLAPVSDRQRQPAALQCRSWRYPPSSTKARSEEHTSELQSRVDLVCRLLLEKKKIPAPPFQEAPRAAAFKELLAEAGLSVQIDKAGNVIGELGGLNEKEIVIVFFFIDTVSPDSTTLSLHGALPI